MDRTKKRQRQRAVIACMLLLTLMPFFLVKAFHVHGEHSCVSHNEQGHSRHDSPEIVFHLSLTGSPRLSRQGFLYIPDYYSDWQAWFLNGILSPRKQMSSSFFSRISSVHPLCVCHNSLEGFACHHCDCVQGLFMSRLNRL